MYPSLPVCLVGLGGTRTFLLECLDSGSLSKSVSSAVCGAVVLDLAPYSTTTTTNQPRRLEFAPISVPVPLLVMSYSGRGTYVCNQNPNAIVVLPPSDSFQNETTLARWLVYCSIEFVGASSWLAFERKIAAKL
mmetsp:Transcript_32498/g.74705  ORF Transcript_32498/g.74705 Transcript_32498/m.74705 type:complete len:134 (+) Transcript_32498:594-995(+)